MPSLLRTVGSVVAALVLAAAVIAAVVFALQILSDGVTAGRALAFVLAATAAGTVVRLVERRRLLTGYAVLVFAVMFTPIVVVVIYAFNGGEVITSWDGFSTRWFTEAADDPQVRQAIGESLKIAVCSALISVILGTAGALVIGRARLSFRLPFEGALFLTLVVPELVFAVGLLLFFIRFGIPFGTQTVMVGHAVFGTSIALLIVRARLTGTGMDLERASADLGAGPWATLRQVTLPRLSPAILASFLLTFVLSFDDVVVSQFTAGGTPTWPLYLLAALRFGISPEVNAASVLLLAIVLLLSGIAALVIRRLARDPSPALSPN